MTDPQPEERWPEVVREIPPDDEVSPMLSYEVVYVMRRKDGRPVHVGDVVRPSDAQEVKRLRAALADCQRAYVKVEQELGEKVKRLREKIDAMRTATARGLLAHDVIEAEQEVKRLEKILHKVNLAIPQDLDKALDLIADSGIYSDENKNE